MKSGEKTTRLFFGRKESWNEPWSEAMPEVRWDRKNPPAKRSECILRGMWGLSSAYRAITWSAESDRSMEREASVGMRNYIFMTEEEFMEALIALLIYAKIFEKENEENFEPVGPKPQITA